jgi:hypothetical protein
VKLSMTLSEVGLDFDFMIWHLKKMENNFAI